MTNDVIFWTQIASILGYVVTAFTLYRLLVDKKDATIQLLKEKAEFIDKQAKEKTEFLEKQCNEKVCMLEKQIDQMKGQSPDIIAETLTKRNEILKQELKELLKDQEKNSQIIASKELELGGVQSELQKLSEQIERAKKFMGEFFCPYCEAPLIDRKVDSYTTWYGEHDIDIEIETIQYECGLEIVDGKEKQPCRNTQDNPDALD
jgi:murein L,D-transpeptidase YcbB/YkuD